MEEEEKMNTGISNNRDISRLNYPIIRESELEIESFTMGFHEYRTIWTPCVNEVLLTRIEPTIKEDKFAVAVIGPKGAIFCHLMKGKSGRFAKTIFHFLRASKNNECK